MTIFHRITTKHVQGTLKFSMNVENFVWSVDLLEKKENILCYHMVTTGVNGLK